MIDKVIAYSKLGRQAQTLKKYVEEQPVRLIIISGHAHPLTPSLYELYSSWSKQDGDYVNDNTRFGYSRDDDDDDCNCNQVCVINIAKVAAKEFCLTLDMIFENHSSMTDAFVSFFKFPKHCIS